VRLNQVLGIGAASPRRHKSVLNWILKEKPLYKGLNDFIWHIDDFVSVTGYSGPDGSSEDLGFWEDFIEGLVRRWRPDSLLKVISH